MSTHSLDLRHGIGTAQALSYLGLIPFVGGVLLAWLPFPELRAQSLLAVAVYGAAILSFLGAVHWGRIVAAPLEDPFASLWLIWAVVPSLLGWVAVLLPTSWTMPGLILGFVLAWNADRRATRAGLLPVWYGTLRDRLTVAVCATLCTSLPLVL